MINNNNVFHKTRRKVKCILTIQFVLFTDTYPTLICKNNVTAETQLGLAGTSILLPSFEVLNMYDYEIFCSPSEEYFFTIGITQVHCYARDSFATSRSCDFFVEVVGVYNVFSSYFLSFKPLAIHFR